MTDGASPFIRQVSYLFRYGDLDGHGQPVPAGSDLCNAVENTPINAETEQGGSSPTGPPLLHHNYEEHFCTTTYTMNAHSICTNRGQLLVVERSLSAATQTFSRPYRK